MQRKTAVAAVAASALAAPAAADAHVTLQPNTAAAGAFTVENVRVPNERDKASTVKVDLQLPHGFVFASCFIQKRRQGCEIGGYLRMIGTHQLFAKREAAACVLDTFCIATTRVREAAQVVQQRRAYEAGCAADHGAL